MKLAFLAILVAAVAGCSNLTPAQQAASDRVATRATELAERIAFRYLEKLDHKAIRPVE